MKQLNWNSYLWLGIFCAITVAPLASTQSLAAEPVLDTHPTDAEMKMLPKACQARITEGYSGPSSEHWRSRLGDKVYLSLHHYCFALNWMNRFRFSVDNRSKRYYLQTAIGQFNYVLKGWPADASLRADAERGKIEAEAMMKIVPKR